MNIDLIKLKALATAAAANQYDAVALNDYGTALPPATVLGLIAEIERHRQVNAEGCKPDSNLLLGGLPCTGFAPCRGLNKAEGCKPDLNTPHLSLTEASVAHSRAALDMAKQQLSADIKRAYPVGSQVLADLGGHQILIEVNGYGAWWSAPGEILGKNVATGKQRRFSHRRVLESHYE